MNTDKDNSDRRKDDDIRKERPWRKDAKPLGKPPSNPNYPKSPFSFDDWMNSSKKMEEDSNEVPEPGDTIRTKKMQMEGVVEKLTVNRAGYDEVLFRVGDGRLMKTPLSNVIVVQKLADEENSVFEDTINEISTELLAKYKKAAGKDASEADKRGDYKRGDKRFSGIVKATKKQFDNDSKKVKEDRRPSVNFTSDDIKSLEKIPDLNAMKQAAKDLVQTKSIHSMKPEKVAYFDRAIDGSNSKLHIIKLMYDLLLAGEGNAVIGSRNSMRSSGYRARFGEGEMGGINRSRPAQDISYEKVLDSMTFEERLQEFLKFD